MVIDIVNYTDEQFASLSAGKLQQIRSAQLKKNKLLQELAERLEKEKKDLIDKGTFVSTILEIRTGELTAACEREIEALREGLLFYLQYVSNGSGGSNVQIPDGIPYDVDFSLSETDRMTQVKNYYETTYLYDAQLRFDAFCKDEFARSYLGEWYASLYHYFEDLI